MDESGRFAASARARICHLLGLLQHWRKERPATVEEMDEAIRAKTAKKFERAFRVEE